MYTTMTCGWCVRAARLLAAKGVHEIDEIDVSFDRSPMIQRTNGRMTVPQIFINGHHVGGYDDLASLERAGQLDALLAADAPADSGD